MEKTEGQDEDVTANQCILISAEPTIAAVSAVTSLCPLPFLMVFLLSL